MIPQAQTAPTAPATSQQPSLSLPGGSVVGGTQLLPRPMTRAEVEALRLKRGELSTQLSSAQGRRNSIARQLEQTNDPIAREGLVNRLRVLDQRMVALEVDIAANGQQLALAPASLLRSEIKDESPVPGLSQGGFVGITIVFTVLVLMPLAIAAARRLWTRPAAPVHNPQLAAQAERIERIEQAIDAVAIEVERISEGQRFVTQLLAKREAAVLPSGVE